MRPRSPDQDPWSRHLLGSVTPGDYLTDPGPRGWRPAQLHGVGGSRCEAGHPGAECWLKGNPRLSPAVSAGTWGPSRPSQGPHSLLSGQDGATGRVRSAGEHRGQSLPPLCGASVQVRWASARLTAHGRPSCLGCGGQRVRCLRDPVSEWLIVTHCSCLQRKSTFSNVRAIRNTCDPLLFLLSCSCQMGIFVPQNLAGKPQALAHVANAPHH